MQAATARGNRTIVERLLEQKVAFGNSFQVACLAADEELVKYLLDKGASVNSDDGGSFGTPLQVASATGRNDIVQMLLERDTKLAEARSWKPQHFGTALQMAIESGNKSLVKLLLSNGADL